MKRKRTLVLLACLSVGLIVALGGCSGISTAKERQAREDLRTTESAYRPQGEKPALPELTPSPGLADLMRYALLNNPRAESAFYEWKAAVEEITVARSLPDPMLTFEAVIMSGLASLVPTLMTDPMNNWPGPGKLSVQAEAAYQEASAKRAAFENELLGTALEVKRAYYQLWVLDEQTRWTREALSVVDDMEELARQRFAVGSVSQQDVLRAQMERDRLRTELAILEDSRSPIMSRLRAALGMGPDKELPALSARLAATPADFTEASLLEVAFERNPRLKEMRSEVLRAEALYQLAAKSKVPDFAFAVGTDVKAPRPRPWMLMAGVTLPIWRDRIAAEIAQGRAATGAANAALSAEELELAVRFAETAFAWREADRNAKLFGERLLPKAKASLESARVGYTGGLSSFLDVLEAQRELLDTHLNHAMAAGQREIVLAEMSLVILGRWPENVVSFLAPQPTPAPAEQPVQDNTGGSR